MNCFPNSRWGLARLIIVLLLLDLLSACAPRRVGLLPPERLQDLACRIVSISEGPVRSLEPLVDANVDTTSIDPADQTLESVIAGNRMLGARIQRVFIQLPRDRFNVTVTLDGKTFLRINHMDLDIYIEMTIENRAYALHCFPEFAANK